MELAHDQIYSELILAAREVNLSGRENMGAITPSMLECLAFALSDRVTVHHRDLAGDGVIKGRCWYDRNVGALLTNTRIIGGVSLKENAGDEGLYFIGESMSESMAKMITSLLDCDYAGVL
jgi:hypothetical protein